MEELRKKLEDELVTTEWSSLEAHHIRQGLVMIDQSLNIVDVAIAFAKDESELVKAWMDQKKLFKPEDHQIKEYKNSSGRRFQFLIVQPFVIAQEFIN